MGFRVAPQHDAVPENSDPSTKEPKFNVDLTDSKDLKGTFDPRCEVGPSNKVPEIGLEDIRSLTAGKPSDILGPNTGRDGITLPQTKIVDGDTVVADGADQAKAANGTDADAAKPDSVPPVLNTVQLNQNTLDAGKVYKREGYYQVAERLLGPGFDHLARKEFTNALRDSWKSQPGKENAKGLSRGDELLTQKNMDAVLNSIKDEGLRGRIRERLASGEAKPPSGSNRDQTPKTRRGADDAPQKEKTPQEITQPEGELTPREGLPPQRKKTQEITTPEAELTLREELPQRKTRRLTPPERDSKPPQITPRDDQFRDPSTQYDFNRPDTDTPKGKLKSAYETRYEVGDQFEGLTSVYRSGRQTASGLPFNKHELTAASKEFPFGTVLKVRNPDTGLETKVVITDHGPFAGDMVRRPDGTKTHARVLDLSVGAANAIGMGFTVKNLQVTVESIPPEGKWGSDRRNIHGDYKRSVLAKINNLSNRRS